MLQRFSKIFNRFQIRPHATFPFSDHTIYALCSGQGKCGVAVIRVSGKAASLAIAKLTKFSEPPRPRYAHLTKILDPETKETLDKGLLLWFPGPGSFTGEDVCEFQVHGGVAIITSILRALDKLNNVRLARPGEFTKRAFYNEKMDLLEAEGLADLINADTELQRKQAFFQSQGVLSKVYKNWKEEVYGCLMNFESLFNFETIEETDSEKTLLNVAEKIGLIRNDIEKHLDDDKRGERLRSGIKTVILGEPNVGKSSLYNFFCKRNAAIVTPFPGTTRDTLEVNLDISGYPIQLYDTCGIRYGEVNPIEAEGVKITLDAVESAELLILMVDVEKYINSKKKLLAFIKTYVIEDLKIPSIINETAKCFEKLFKKRCIILINKCDEVLIENLEENALSISLKTKNGLENLVTSMERHLNTLCAEPTIENPAITKVRHRNLLENSLQHLTSFLEKIYIAQDTKNLNTLDYGLLGNDLRYSLRYITEIIEGRKDNTPVVDVLDEIFHNFCIGK